LVLIWVICVETQYIYGVLRQEINIFVPLYVRSDTEHKLMYNARSVYDMIHDMTYFLTATRLTPSGSSTVNIYTQTIHRIAQLTNLVGRLSWIRTQSGQTNWQECGSCPVFASYTLAFALQLRKRMEKPYLTLLTCKRKENCIYS